MRALAGPGGGVHLDHDVAPLAAALRAPVPDVVGDVAATGRDPLDGLEDALLEGAALARPGLLLLGQLGLGLGRVVEALDLALELGQPLEQPLARLAVVLHLPHDGRLELGQGVVPVLGGELAQQILA